MDIQYITPFNIKVSNLGVHSCNTLLLQDGTHTKAEIVYNFDKNTCWTIAKFVYNGDCDWNLQFQNDRPLDDCVDWSTFRDVVKSGYDYLRKNTVYLEVRGVLR